MCVPHLRMSLRRPDHGGRPGCSRAAAPLEPRTLSSFPLVTRADEAGLGENGRRGHFFYAPRGHALSLMPAVEKDIEVNAPVDEVYAHWTRYESFPRFMSNIKEVRRTGNERTHWVAQAAGQTIEWDARTTAENGRRVAWTAEGESGQSGEVRFESMGPDKTRLHLKMDYRLPSKLQEAAATLLQIDDAIVSRDLHQFKEMVEQGTLD